MTPAQHRRAKAIFLDACEMAAEARVAFVHQHAADDEVVREAALRLLANDTATAFDADESLRSRVVGLLDPPPLPDAIGRYRVLRVLGEGGFGTVYEAEQGEPVRRAVALKVIKPGMGTHEVLNRFAAERQVLAMMHHPCIATVFDAGSTDDGRPWFAMELVTGAQLVVYSNSERLDLRARLSLFLRACSAIQHAHQKGVLHRDLKPSNVLVTTIDGVPVPKVIDFGIAKALDPTAVGIAATREHGRFLGTPEYVSPEQAAGERDIDTRTDIYSMGIVLYELVAGTTPIDRVEVEGLGIAAMLDRIQNAEPKTPSSRLSQLGPRAVTIAQERRTEPAALARALRGDLDWIVMKAIEKDRTRRYASIDALADDVARFLADEPVLARAPSAAYRFRKFARRNRGLLAATIAMFVLLVGGILGTSIGLVRALDARRDEAEQRALADTINAVLQNALEASDPYEGGRADLLVAEAMQRVVQRLDEGVFADHAATEAALRLSVARTLLGNDHAAEALPLVERALACYASLGAAGSDGVLRGTEIEALLLDRLGRLAEAEQRARTLLAQRSARFPGDHEDVVSAHRLLGLVLQHAGKFEAAKDQYEAALGMGQRLHAGDHASLAAVQNNIATLQQNQGQSALAEAAFREALMMLERLHPDGHPQVAKTLANLAMTLLAQNRGAEAEPFATRSLAIYRRLLRPGHADLTVGLTALGFVHKVAGRLQEAEALLREALDIAQRNARGDHPGIVYALSNLADVVVNAARHQDAEALLRQARDMNARLFPTGHPTTAKLGSNLAVALHRLGRKQEALDCAAEAAALATRVLPPQHPLRAQCERIHDRLVAGH